MIIEAAVFCGDDAFFQKVRDLFCGDETVPVQAGFEGLGKFVSIPEFIQHAPAGRRGMKLGIVRREGCLCRGRHRNVCRGRRLFRRASREAGQAGREGARRGGSVLFERVPENGAVCHYSGVRAGMTLGAHCTGLAASRVIASAYGND